jgi:lipopolysaccharide biosynthesis glycosyltransferase
MPIFEKENVFEYFKDYEKCCVIDSDIWIRPGSPNIFNEIDDETVASVYECDLPMNEAYAQKIKGYSTSIWSNYDYDWEWNPRTGGAFFNSGVMLYNSKKMLQALNGMSPRQFLEQSILADFVDGVGPLKWQSDQMTLNYWFKVKGIDVKKLDWKWNALYTAVLDIKEAFFVHFFLKDKLPDSGENVERLMEEIQ